MGPRVREDDKIRDRKGLIDRSYKEEVGISKDETGDRTTPLSHKHSAHHHISSRRSRTHGKPFIRDRLCRVGNTLATTDNKSNDNTVAIPTYYTRYTMGPRVREDDETRDGKKKPSEDQRQRTKNLHTAVTSPTVVPVHTGNHLSAHAGCRVWKYTRHNRQQEQRQYSSNTYPLHLPYHGSPRPRGLRDKRRKEKAERRSTPKNKNSEHRRHITNCHSRAHGKPFVRTRRMSRLETHSPQQTTRATTIQ